MPSQDPGTGDHTDTLSSVAAVSASNVWAFGSYYDGATNRTLIEHWDGSRWSVVPSPNPWGGRQNSNDRLDGVAAVSASDVWAVGTYFNGVNDHTLTVHWDGSSWSYVPSANANENINYLSSVAATSASNVWAVGEYFNGSQLQTLTEWFHC